MDELPPPPYLPHPHPVQKVGGAQSQSFASSHPDCKFPGRGFQSYGQWWQAHQNERKDVPLFDKPIKATSFWPYGQGMTTLTNCPAEDLVYPLDSRMVRNCMPDKRPHPGSASTGSMFRTGSSPVLQSAGSGAVMLGFSQERKNRHRQ